MVRIARRKARERGLDVEFVVGDMRRLGFASRFDAVTCFFTSINYNVMYDDLLQTFRGVYESLREGGVFVADAPNPYRAERWLKGTPSIWRVDAGETSILVLDAVYMSSVSAEIDWNRTLIVSEKGEVKMYPDRHVLRGYTAGELKYFAKQAGFKEVKIYGDMRITEQEPRDAKRLYLVAVK